MRPRQANTAFPILWSSRSWRLSPERQSPPGCVKRCESISPPQNELNLSRNFAARCTSFARICAFHPTTPRSLCGSSKRPPISPKSTSARTASDCSGPRSYLPVRSGLLFRPLLQIDQEFRKYFPCRKVAALSNHRYDLAIGTKEHREPRPLGPDEPHGAPSIPPSRLESALFQANSRQKLR